MLITRESTMEVLFFAGAALSLVALVVAAIWVWRRPTPLDAVVPRPVVFRNIRVLHDDDEIRDLARRASEREQLIATAAGRRATRLGELARPRLQTAGLRVVANPKARESRQSAAPDRSERVGVADAIAHQH